VCYAVLSLVVELLSHIAILKTAFNTRSASKINDSALCGARDSTYYEALLSN